MTVSTTRSCITYDTKQNACTEKIKHSLNVFHGLYTGVDIQFVSVPYPGLKTLQQNLVSATKIHHITSGIKVLTYIVASMKL